MSAGFWREYAEFRALLRDSIRFGVLVQALVIFGGCTGGAVGRPVFLFLVGDNLFIRRLDRLIIEFLKLNGHC